MNYLKQTIVALVTITLSISCSSDKKKPTPELPSLSLGVMSSMDYLPLAVAQREGYFEAAGVEVHIQKFMSANEREVALQSGAIDGAITDYTSAALLQAGGFDFKLTSKCQAPFYIVAGGKTGINTLADLKGKKIAVSQNTVIDFCVDMALASVHLTPTDVEKVEINKIPLRLEMLRNSKIAATGLPNPFALIAQSEGDKLLVSMDSLGYTVTGIVFSQKAIDTNSEAMKKMYSAYNKGVEYIKTHTIADVKDILVKDLGFPETLAMQVMLPNYTNAQAIKANDKDILQVVTWLSNKKLVKPNFQTASLINDTLVQ